MHLMVMVMLSLRRNTGKKPGAQMAKSQQTVRKHRNEVYLLGAIGCVILAVAIYIRGWRRNKRHQYMEFDNGRGKANSDGLYEMAIV